MKVQENLERDEPVEKNKILEAARSDKYKGKEFENRAFEKGNLLSSAAALLIGIILFLLGYFVKNSANMALLAVGMADVSIQNLYEGIKTKKRFLIVWGSVCGVLATVFIVASIMQVVV